MNYRGLIYFGIFGFVTTYWIVFTEIDYHYLIAYQGTVIKKQQTPPKKIPYLVIKGSKEAFPVWKWEGINFDSVKIGDSIAKNKFESNAYYYKKTTDNKFIKVRLRYWTHL
jgi:hypothetical protein